MICEYKKNQKGEPCIRCGRPLLVQLASPPSRECKAAESSPPRGAPETCRHFLGVTGERTEAISCRGCKTAAPMTALAECEKHGEVTFIHQAKDRAIRYCPWCPDYVAG